MNLLLLHPNEVHSNARVHFTGERLSHLQKFRDLAIGSRLKAGLINGKIGNATVVELSNGSAELAIALDTSPPPPLPLTLIIALPRPKMIKRILQTIATMGVKQLIFINSYRVEKSYWQTPLLRQENIREQLILGLEQGIDTTLPNVRLVKRFKPFVEDELADMCNGKRALVAHPAAQSTCPAPNNQETVLVIGPEGGFIDYEIDKLNATGCHSVQLGSRILRVETAVPVLLARLFPV